MPFMGPAWGRLVCSCVSYFPQQEWKLVLFPSVSVGGRKRTQPMLWSKEVFLSLKNREVSHALSPRSPDEEVVGPQGTLTQVGAAHTQMRERGNWD